MSRWLVIGDLHFGERGDSEKFNNSILDFVEWAIDTGLAHKVDKVVQLGDWFHSRSKIQVQTLNYGVVGAQMLGQVFGRENVYVLEGNHDLFYLDRLDISSINVLSPYVTVIHEPTMVGDIMMTPWIASGEQWDEVVNASKDAEYLFAHLELNGFMVNDRYEMEHGQSHRELRGYKRVLTGHYHSMQEKDNILYVGTPYPITMNEANEDHGVFIFDDVTGKTTFETYQGIKVISVDHDKLDEVLAELGDDVENTTIRVVFGDDVTDDSIVDEVQEKLSGMAFDGVRIKFNNTKSREIMSADIEVSDTENIDDVVVKVIRESVDIDGIDKKMLEALYLQLKTEEK
jgi:DNA repair exonuclease SbcCD nuclease subunit